MPETTYYVRDCLGNRIPVEDAERASRLAQSGYRVSAVTEGSA